MLLRSLSRRFRLEGTAAFLLVSLALFACSPSAERIADAGANPEAIDDQEGAVCGMLVRDQPAPRGQVIHRDGTRLFLCSLGDLLVHLSVPSRHGAAEQILVEALDAAADPLALQNGTHPWLDARVAHYVVGTPRRATMGPPVLVYAAANDARRIADRFEGAEALDFEGLLAWWASSPAARPMAPGHGHTAAPPAQRTKEEPRNATLRE